MEHQRNSGTPRNSGGTTEYYPENQRNNPEYQRNTNVTPVEHLGTIEPYKSKTKNNCNIFKRKFKPQNLKFRLKFETFLIADTNYLFIYLFIYFCLFKVGLPRS